MEKLKHVYQHYHHILLHTHTHIYRGQDSAAGLAARYRMDIPRIESQWGRDCPRPSRPALGPLSVLHNGYPVFPGSKMAEE